MKAPAIFAIVIGVIVGFMLGGMSPRRELADAQNKIDDLQRRVRDAEKRAKTATGGGNRFMPFFPEFEQRAEATPRPTAKPGESPLPEASSTPFDPEEARRAFGLAVDAQRVRARQSRAALEERARLSEEEQEAIDKIIENMNQQLKAYADEMLDIVLSGEEPDPRDLLAMTHDVSGVLLDAQTAFEEQIGGDMEGLGDSESQVWNYVDLETFREAFDRAAAAGALPD